LNSSLCHLTFHYTRRIIVPCNCLQGPSSKHSANAAQLFAQMLQRYRTLVMLC